MNDFSEYRKKVREAIEKYYCEPIMAEDFPSSANSPHIACIDMVASCDVFLLIIAERGGFTSPSGKLVIEEEYDEAVKNKIPVLLFIKDGAHDPDAQKFIDRLSDYSSGYFRATFNNPEELNALVCKSISQLEPVRITRGKDMDDIVESIGRPEETQFESIMRIILIPERSEEIFDEILTDANGFIQNIYGITHSTSPPLFSYEISKKKKVSVSNIEITQSNKNANEGYLDYVKLNIALNGTVFIDVNVSSCVPSANMATLNGAVILRGDVENKLLRVFTFLNELFEKQDPYRRYNRFHYQVLLNGLKYKAFKTEYRQGEPISMRMDNEDELQVYDEAKLIDRRDLSDPSTEIKKVLNIIERKME